MTDARFANLPADVAVTADLSSPASALFVGSGGLPAIVYLSSFKDNLVADGDGVLRLVRQLGFAGQLADTDVALQQVSNFGSAVQFLTHHISFEDGRDQRRRDIWCDDKLLVLDAQQIGRRKHTYKGNPDKGAKTFNFGGSEYVWYPFAEAWEANGLNIAEVIANRNGDIRCIGDDLIWGGQELHSVACPETVTYLPLPTVRQAEYLFSLGDGQLLYVSSDRYSYAYESLKLFIGRGDSFSEFAVSGVYRLRCGITRYVTEIGDLWTRPQSVGPAISTWQGKAVKQCVADDFVIQDDGNKVIITPKQG
jgi:hypothetical protein